MKRTFAAGRFEVVRALGSGGMGEVYEVLDREQGLRVALKQLRNFSPEALMELKAEFRAVRDLNHPNLVSLGELVVDEGQWFFTMELVEGTDFLGYVRPGMAAADSAEATTGPGSDSATAAVECAPLVLQERAEAPAPSARAPPPESIQGLDEARLRDGLRQLSEALLALHGAGMVHRDVKPPNIRVTREGRLVLLDFGLVAREGSASATAKNDRLLGTPLYMAPEQIQSARAGPPADWYAVGMLLFHALLGRPPVVGSVKTIFLRKLRGEVGRPSAVLRNVPADLDALCAELLDVAPERRPTGPEVLERVGGGEQRSVEAAEARARGTPFVGREAELEVLRRAFAEVRKGGAVSVVLQGESGLGKTALGRTFVEQLARSAPSPLVFAGRSDERESLPYKALDGVVDDLAEHLSSLPDGDAARLTPAHAGLLTRAFPVLGRLPSFASAECPAPEQLAPGEQRRRVFHALRALLAGIARDRPLVLFLDDMQWADADSLAALRAVFQPPELPGILVLATARGDKGQLWAPPPPYGLAALGLNVRHVLIEPLSTARTLELVEQLMPGGSGLLPARAATLAAASGGHPLFIQELVLHLGERGSREVPEREDSAFQLDEAIWSRITRLPLAPRTLLGLVALAGSALPNEIFADAAGLSSEEYAQAVTTLRQGRLVRAMGLKRRDTLEHFHDRIRESVFAHLTALQRRESHERIARALERHEHPEAEALALHWQGAGDSAAALRYAEQAAVQAEGALAFDRAVRLRRLAMSLALALNTAPEALRGLQRRLADALTRAGQNAEAARCYEEAAASAPPHDAIQLKALSAERYLLAGYLKEGIPQLRQALQALKLPWRQGSLPTLVSILALRVWMKLKGLRYRLRAEADVPAELLLRVDTLGACSAPLSFIDVVGASYYNVRYIMAALEAGEIRRLARGFALEFGLVSALTPNDVTRAEQLLAQAELLAHQGGDKPDVLAFIGLQKVICAYTRDGNLDATIALSERAQALYREHGAGAAWELASLGQFINFARCQKGDWSAMRASVLEKLAEAEDRGDVFGIACASTAALNCSWLVLDDPDEARRRLDVATERYPRDRTYVVHFYEFLARANLDLYLGDGAAAHRRVLEMWAPIARTFLLEVPMIKYLMWDLRGRAALGLAAQARGAPQKALLRRAREAAAKVAGTKFDWGSAGSEILLAGVEALEGRTELAATRLEAAEPRFAKGGAGLFLWVAQLARGKLMGGDRGRVLVNSARASFKEQGVLEPDKVARIFNPVAG